MWHFISTSRLRIPSEEETCAKVVIFRSLFRSIVLEKWVPIERKDCAIFGVGERDEKGTVKRAEARGKSTEGPRIWNKAKEMAGVKRMGQEKIGEANERIREKWRKKELLLLLLLPLPLPLPLLLLLLLLQRKWLYRKETYDFCVRHSNYCAPITIFMKRVFVLLRVMKYLSSIGL